MLKILYSIFLAILIPVYTRTYGVQNFLWLSDVGLFLTFFALWLQSPLLMGMAAVGVLPFEIFWAIDFFFKLITGYSLIGISDYMFDHTISKFVRGLSLFHLVMPFIWIYFLYKWHYDERAIFYMTGLTWMVLIVTWLFTEPSANINWVFIPQINDWKWMPSFVWLMLILIGYPLIIFLPLHLIFKKLF